MEEAVLNDKEISDYLDKYDISYWNYIVPRLVKIAIRDIEKNKPDIYTIDEIDEYLKEKDPNPQIEEKDPYEGMWPENSQNDNLEIKDLNSSSPQNDFSNQNKNDFQNNEYSNENENKYISPIDKQYKKNLQNSYENPMKTSYNNPIKSTLDNSYKYNDYQSPIKNYNYPINNSYQNSIKNSYDIGYKPSNYLMNPMNNYSNRNNYSSLETRARSPRYTYECNPSNYGNNSYRNNSFRNPSFGSQRSNLPNLNYDYNNYRLRRNNFDDDCCNKSAQFLSSYSYRPNYTSGY